MRLNVKAVAFAVALVWGGAVLLVSFVNWILPGYGEEKGTLFNFARFG